MSDQEVTRPEFAEFSKTVSIVMPAYNEEENIEKTVLRCAETLKDLHLNGEIVVTDDGSRDRTRLILNDLKAKIPNLVVVEHEENQGYGAGLCDAVRASKGEVVVSMDSDGQFDIKELPLLIELYLKGHRIVTGFRKSKRDSFLKVFADRCLNIIVRIMFGIQLKDVNCAFKLYDSELIRSIKVESRGFSAPTEVMIRLQASGNSIAETPITHSAREKGKSALKVVGTSINFMLFLIYLKLKQYLYRSKVVAGF